jgi:hypothetical protein
MKRLFPLLLALLLLDTADAQLPQQSSYTIISMGFGSVFLKDPGKGFGVSFPYSSFATQPNGVDTQATFNGAVGNSFSNRMVTVDLPDFEVVFGHDNRHAINLGGGLNKNLENDYSFFLKTGYKYVFTFHDLQIKPGFDVYYLLGHNKTIGSINNIGSEIHVLGFTASDSWTQDYSDDNGNDYQQTYYADHLDVDYRRKSLDLDPNLTLTVNPVGKFVFSIQAGWFLQISQASQLNFLQSDWTNNKNHVGTISLDHNGTLTGPYVGMSIGMAIPNK